MFTPAEYSEDLLIWYFDPIEDLLDLA